MYQMNKVPISVLVLALLSLSKVRTSVSQFCPLEGRYSAPTSFLSLSPLRIHSVYIF